MESYKDGIDIEVTFRNVVYKISAYRMDGNEGQPPIYRLLHKDLWLKFCHLKRMYSDIKLTQESVYIDNGKNIVKAFITTKDGEQTTFFGETNIRYIESESEKARPFITALNFAVDKAIMDLLGLETKYFKEDGTPVYYPDIERMGEIFTDNDLAQFNLLGEMLIKVRNSAGTVCKIRIHDITPSIEKFYREFDPGNNVEFKTQKDNVLKYLKLREKKLKHESKTRN